MKQQVVVIHGGGAFNTYKKYIEDLKSTTFDLAKMRKKGWKLTLQDKLGKSFDVIQPRMPNASNARYREWKIVFDRLVPHLNDQVILVGHSLGAIFLVKYLSEERFAKSIRATFLIAAPYNTQDSHPLADFNLKQPVTKLAAQAGALYFYHSKDDKTVPISNLHKYKRELPGAKIRLFVNKGHFNQEEFRELVKEIKSASLT